jgi:hypothetical protein
MWDTLDEHLEKKSRAVRPIVGMGFCLLRSVLIALENDTSIKITEEQLQCITCAHLKENAALYIAFHEGDELSLKLAVREFFLTRRYNTDVVDIIVKIIADALNVNIFIYKENTGRIEVDKYGAMGMSTTNVYIRFTQGNVAKDPTGLGNHYDPIVLDSAAAQVAISKQLQHDREERKRLHDLKYGRAKRSLFSEEKEETVPLRPPHPMSKTSRPLLPPMCIGQVVAPPVTAHDVAAMQTSPLNLTLSASSETSSRTFVAMDLSKKDSSVTFATTDLSKEHSCVSSPPVPTSSLQSSSLQSPTSLQSSRHLESSPEKEEEEREIEDVALQEVDPWETTPEKSPPKVQKIDKAPMFQLWTRIGHHSPDEPVVKDMSAQKLDQLLGIPEELHFQTTSERETRSPVDAIYIEESPMKFTTALEEDHIDLSEVVEVITTPVKRKGPPPPPRDGEPGQQTIPIASIESGLEKGQPFPTWEYDATKAPELHSLPREVNGCQLFKIRTTKKKLQRDTNDRWHFKMTTSNLATFDGLRRVGWCDGSWVCGNDDCEFLKSNPEKKPNTFSWVKSSARTGRTCISCRQFAEREKCRARKLVEFDHTTGVAMVYHLGVHQCTMKPDKTSRRDQIEEEMSKRTRRIGPKDMQREMTRRHLDDWDIESADKAANTWSDYRFVENIQEARKVKTHVDMNSFDAVCNVKRNADKVDPYWMYRVNCGAADNTSDYIFKSSTKMAELGIAMDKDAGLGNPLEEETCYFDAVHNRVKGFKSFALWVMHPATHAIIRLANMEMRSENATDIARFFTMWNQILAKVKGEEGYKFNPKKFMCDSAGANMQAIKRVYGELDLHRVQTCK